MVEEPDRVRRDIEATRASLTRDVDLLAEKASPRQAARRRWTAVREKVMGGAESTSNKAEVKQEAVKAGKAAGMLGGAGFAGYLAVVLLSFAVVFGLANVMDAGWAALVVAVVWAAIGAALYATGRKRLKTVDPVPRRTVDTIKEDAQWLKNPTG